MEAAEVSRSLDCKGGVKEAFTKVIFVTSIENYWKWKLFIGTGTIYRLFFLGDTATN